MIGTIRRHSQVLWWIIVIAVIVTFTAFYGASNRPFEGLLDSRGGRFGAVYGRPIKPAERDEAARLVQLGMALQSGGRASRNEENLQRETYRFLFFREKMRQLGIAPGDPAVAAFIRENLTDPKTGRLQYDDMVAAVKQFGYAEADYVEFIRHQVGMTHLRQVVGVPARLVTPREAEAEFRRENEQVVVSVAHFSSSNHLATVPITPEGLGRFFTNRLASYRTPERKQLAYVRFASSNFLAAVETEALQNPAFTNELEAIYNQRGADAFRDADDKPMAREAALAKLRSDRLQFEALSRARQQAVDFYNDLAQLDTTFAAFEKVAAQRNVPATTTTALAAFDRTTDFADLRSYGEVFSRLNADQPYSEPQLGASNVFIVALKQQVPSEVPPLDSVRARVTEDYRRSLALEAARQAGAAFHQAVTNGLAQGRTFAAVADEQKVKAVEVAPFSLSMQTVTGLPLQLSLAALKNTAFALQPGKASDFVNSGDGGFVLFVKERKALDEAMVTAGVGAFLSELRQRGEMEAFQAWFTDEYKRSGLADLGERPALGAAPGGQ